MPWRPITDLPEHHASLANEELARLGELWSEQRAELDGSGALRDFLQRLTREWAIETGLIERLYTLDRGITQLLVEQGIDAALIPHRAVDGNPERVAALMTDQLDVAEGLFGFVSQDRALSVGYIKELHGAMTRHQETATAMTMDGNLVEVPLLRGAFKRTSNNPTRPNGTVHEYTPPEHVDAEMDRLVAMHLAHERAGIAPEVSASWLHHRFAQIHPFQDGNGRVARALATLVFLRAAMFPPVVRNDEDRADYITALERADGGDLGPLATLFARIEKRALLSAIGLSSRVMAEQRDMGQVIAALAEASHADQKPTASEWEEALGLAEAIRDHAFQRIETVRQDLRSALPGGEYRIYADTFGPDDARSRDYRFDVETAARQLGYYANFDAYRGWSRLKIRRLKQFQDEIVIAVDALGRDFRGGIAAVALSIRRDLSDDPTPREVRVLTEEPFSLTYHESAPAVVERFTRWLEPALLLAIDRFRRAIASGD